MEKSLIVPVKKIFFVMLDLKFGDAAQSVIAEIQSITDLDTLERLIAHIKPAQTLDEIWHIYAPDQQ